LPPKAKASVPELAHAESCKGGRVESYMVLSPGGSEVKVTRCRECGAHEAK